MEYPYLFNAKDLIHGIFRGREKHFINERMINESTKRGGASKKATRPLNETQDDIDGVLKKWNEFSTAVSVAKPTNSRKEKDCYFPMRLCQETDENVFQIFRATGLPSKLNNLHTCSITMRNNKKNLGTISRPSSSNSTNSNQIQRKGPELKSKQENLKEKIVLTADAVVDSAEKALSQEQRNLTDDELTSTISNRNGVSNPVATMDSESIGTHSQQSVQSENCPTIKRSTETNTITSSMRSGSEIECLAKLSTLLRKVFLEKKQNACRFNNQKIRRVKTDTPSKKKRNSSKSFAELTPKPRRKREEVCDKYETSYTNSKYTYPTMKSSFNIKCTSQLPNKRKRASVSRNPILKDNTLLSRSKVSSTSNNISSNVQLNLKESNKSVKSKQSEKDTVHHREDIDRINQTRRKSKTRSNTTLNSNNVRAIDDWNMKNSVRTEPSLLKNNSTTSSVRGGIRRDNSLVDRTHKFLSVSKRASSFVTPKPNVKFNSDRKASSFSSFYGYNNPMKDDKFRITMVKQVQEEVKTAIRNKKTFTICGDYPAVRKALKSRGWVEKYDSTTTEKLEQEIKVSNQRSVSEMKNLQREKTQIDICKRLLQSKLLASHQVDLYWVANSLEVDFNKIKSTKINKFSSNLFNNEDGQAFSVAVKNADSYNFPELAKIRHPRTYILTKSEEVADFIKDFRLTAAMSLLKWVIRCHKKVNCAIISNSGTIPLKAFQFATNECFKKVIEASTSDLDEPVPQVSDNDWNEFLECYYNIIHIGHHFQTGNLETENSAIEKATYVIDKLKPLYPNIEMDGLMNIWILKPTKGVKEKGIHICRTLEYIMKTAKSDENVNFAVQKYIERPLLIFNTKFDIRQWFLISSTVPLTIWMYKECYLRFSPKTQNLKKLHESIHASAHYVPKQYQNTARNITLPNYNMWDSQQFRNYLSSIGLSEVYSEVTYKGMKECIIWAVLAHQDKIDKRKQSFELFEVDFMLTEDFQPWLIEIYPNPALRSTNPVTSRMCSRVVEDTMKVIVDRAENPKADTGNFEMIYKQSNLSSKSECDLRMFKLFGKQPDEYFDSNWKKIHKENKPNDERVIETKSESQANGLTQTLESLLKFIQTEKKKRHSKKLITAGTDSTRTIENVETKKSSDFHRSRRISFKNLKSQLDMLTGYGEISMAEEDRNMIGYALKMLKNRNNDEVIRYLIEIIESVLKRSTLEKNKN